MSELEYIYIYEIVNQPLPLCQDAEQETTERRVIEVDMDILKYEDVLSVQVW